MGYIKVLGAPDGSVARLDRLEQLTTSTDFQLAHVKGHIPIITLVDTVKNDEISKERQVTNQNFDEATVAK